MPPEPLSFNRKDFLKERKHEKSDSVGSIARWRDSHHGSRELVRSGLDEFRRPTGHSKLGGYQIFSTRSVHGCTAVWEPASDKTVGVGDETSIRPSTILGDAKHVRNNREIKGIFQDLKGYPCETGDASARQHYISAQRTDSGILPHISTTHSDTEHSSWDHLHFEDQHNKMSMDGLATGHRYNADQSLGLNAWTPMKWNRSSSLSSRGSGLSHSSSTRSSDETKLDLQSGRVTPLQSPSGDAVGGVTSYPLFEETCPRKKQRLGWGQGLAKYEKRKVEGSDETVSKNVLVPFAKTINICQRIIPILPDKSPRVTGLSDCASPATTSSVAWSSSPGLEDSLHFKGANNDIGTSNLNGSPGHGFQSCLEEFSINLEHLELSSATIVGSMLIDLLQLEDASSGDSNCMKSTAMNKLLLLKSEASKVLEKIECEIDLFENELKLLNSEPEINGSGPTSSDYLKVECTSKSREVGYVPNAQLQKPVPLQLVSSGGALEEVCGEVIDEDIDSPGTVTSKFVEPLSMEKGASMSYIGKHNGCTADVAGSSTSSEQQPAFGDKNTASESGGGDGNHQKESSTSGHVSSNLGHTECKLNDLILASNRDYARKASEVFNKLLPTNQSQIDIWSATGVSCPQSNVLVKEKLVMRKCSLRFKERILALKFRAFQHLWKEDMRLLSTRKHRAKSQKRFESSSRMSLAYQKNRSSIRSRFTSPAGNLTLVSTTEIVDFNSKLLSDSQIKRYRNGLKMPALMLHAERNPSRFVTSNGLVEDPCAVEKERAIINPWMPEEKELFLEMLATCGKDFNQIAKSLQHKSTADCIEFYYKNHKSKSFEKIKKQSELKKQDRGFQTNTYLVTSGKKWNREVRAAHADGSTKVQQTCGRRSLLGGYSDYKTFWDDDTLYENSSHMNICGSSEREVVAADALASICGTRSSEVMSSCVTSSVDPGEGCQERKFQKWNSVIDRPLTPEVMHYITDEETCSDDCCGEVDSMDWTDDEKSIFIGALRSHGKDFAKISLYVGSKSKDQCKIFFSKARKCLGLDMICLRSGNESTAVNNANGGRSDAEDACVLEMESAICSTQSCSKMDVDFLLSATDMNFEELGHSGATRQSLSARNTNCEASGHSGTTHQRTEPDRLGKNNVMEPLDHADAVTQDAAALDCDLPVPLNESPDLIPEIDVPKGRAGPTAPLIEESVCAREPAGHTQSLSNAAAELNTLAIAPTEGLKTGSEHWGVRTALDAKNSRSSSCCFLQDSITNRNASHSETSFHPSFSLGPDNQPQIISWQQENCPGPANVVLRDFSVAHYEDHLRQATKSSTLTFEEPKNNQHQKPESEDVYEQYLSHYSKEAVSSKILRGYPLHELKKEMNGHAGSFGCKEHRKLHPNQFFPEDFYLEKGNGSKPPHTVSLHPLLSRCQEQSSMGHSKLHSQCSSDSEGHSCQTGDFKLFGQILSHPQKTTILNSTTEKTTDDKGVSFPKSSSKSSRLASAHEIDRALMPSKLDTNNFSSLDEFPTRSYGYWDGNRIQTGLSSLPDSAMLMSKYTTAFSDQPCLPAVIKRNDRNMGCVAVFPSKDLGDLSDYQVYRSLDRTKMQPFAADAKRHDELSKQQKCNGFVVTSFQQHAKGLVGMNVMGSGGILVGEGCTGVSDPVAAIKMHYAASTREEEGTHRQ